MEVSYQHKPKVCSGCKSLGHLVSACPVTIRKWVRKVPPENNDVNLIPETVAAGKAAPPDFDVSAGKPTSSKTDGVDHVDSINFIPEAGAEVQDNKDNNEWQEVTHKKKLVAPVGDLSSSPVPFKGLRRVDEVDKKRGISLVSPLNTNVGLMSKSQLKRLKKSKGKTPKPSL